MTRIFYEEMKARLKDILMNIGFTESKADKCAELFADASRDGVYSHGLNRFPSFIEQILQGDVHIHAEPTKIAGLGALEQWDGHYGPGNLNANASMQRAVTLAKEHGIGCVALKNTNHWMRAGNYGWQAAGAGCIGICWTNTMPNMPPWGSRESKIGNNPIVFAIPRDQGHIVLDTAMSQFSYGQIQSHLLRNERLPVDGGYDHEGHLTRDPQTIMDTKRTLPIGFWKGSGLSIMLDLIAMMLSGGRSTFDIGKDGGERGISQVFIAIDPASLPDQEDVTLRIEETIADLHLAATAEDSDGVSVRYPGEDTLRRRSENLANGIPVEPSIWNKVMEMWNNNPRY